MSPAAPAGAWLRLLAAAGANGCRFVPALRAATAADRLLGMSASELRRVGLGSDDIERLRLAPSSPPDNWQRWFDIAQHSLVTYGSAAYPERLAEIADPPLALWVDGRLPELLAHPQLAVVGSRSPTQNGRATAERFAAELSELGITVTSGLATGIDAASHRGALRGPAGTVAVLGSGIDCIYPRANTALAASVREGGLIVSEYAPQHGVHAWQFPRRNRIIAALTLGTLVVEATVRSGSLITARLAVESGREVFAVPGSIHNALSRGCHKLIRKGAKLVDSVSDILEEIAPQLLPEIRANVMQGADSTPHGLPRVIADNLDFSPLAFDSLLTATGLTPAELSSMLLHLELEGKIEALPGGRYCRLAKRA